MSASVGARAAESSSAVDTDPEADPASGPEAIGALLEAVPAPLLRCTVDGRPVGWNLPFAELLGLPALADGRVPDAVARATIAFALPSLAAVCGGANGGAGSHGPSVRIGAGREFEPRVGEAAHARDPQATVVVLLHEVTDERRAMRQLGDAREEIVQFKYHVSHDLGAPIASVRSLLGLIGEDLEAGATDEVPEMLEETNAQLSRLERLIADLMSLARAGAEDIAPSEVDLRELVDEIVASISLHSRELEVSVSLSFDSPTLRTERVRLRQILANLISNARKFRDPDEVAPFVHVKVADDGDEWRIEVSDNGIGMNAGIAARAFDMFTRGTSTHPGHGLGLHIVLKHLDRLGGRVRVGRIAKPTVIEVMLPK